MASPLHISGTDIASWAARRSAQESLPVLLRRLVRASGSGLSQLSFRADEGVQLEGYDGLVVLETPSSPYVPEGASVWELSTDDDPSNKATRDYDKRTSAPQPADPASSTYVAVSARRWRTKAKWAAAKRAAGVWKDVRALDADDLSAWLESHPPVSTWLGGHLNKSAEGAAAFDDAWKQWSRQTTPPISVDLALAGREDSARELCKSLQRGGTGFAVQAASRDEAYGFVLAALTTLPIDAIENLRSHFLAVDGSAALRSQAAQQSAPILFLVRNVDEEAVAFALANGHCLIRPLGRSTTGFGQAAFQVPKLKHEPATKALRAMGVASTEAGRLAQVARRSLRNLRRQLAPQGFLAPPPWSQGVDAPLLPPIFLLGTWNEAKVQDRGIVEKLTGRPYGEVQARLLMWANDEDPPVVLVADEWRLVSRDDLWAHARAQTNPDLIKRFVECVETVLLAADPRRDLEPEKRWMASLLGKVQPYSSALAKGLVETLSYLGSLDEHADMPLWLLAAINRGVKGLLDAAEADVARWHLLNPHLRGLAEASPELFLRFMERTLAASHPTADQIFSQTDPLYSFSPHTEMLWALEILAWSPKYVARASLALAHLAAIDPGGKTSNRPINSLRSIFLSWCPQTDAGVEVREGVLTLLRQRQPKVAWRLLDLLMPKGHDSGVYNPVPDWRPWGENQHERRTSRSDSIRVLNYVIDAELSDVGTSVDRWIDLIADYGSVSPSHRQRLRTQLQALEVTQVPDPERARLQAAIRGVVSRYRSFPDAQWSIELSDVDALDAVGALFHPRAAAYRFAWLFSSWPTLPDGREANHEVHSKEVRRLRGEAIATALVDGGVPSVEQLAQLAELPESVGIALGLAGLEARQEEELLSSHLASEASALRQLAIGYVVGRVAEQGEDWADQLLASLGSRLSALQKRDVLLGLPLTARTWDLALALGNAVDDAYWGSTNLFVTELPLLERAARRLLAQRRPFAALSLVAHHHKATLDPVFVLTILEGPLGDKVDTPRDSVGYWIPLLLDKIIDAPGIDPGRLAQLEWALLPLFDGRELAPKVLHRELARSPSFFMELVRLVYPAKGEGRRDVDEAETRRAGQAWRLLHHFRLCPGSQEDGTIDGAALMEWVTEVRRLAAEQGRTGIADDQIGEVLSGSPKGSDGVWPHEAVREVVETVARDELDEGLMTGVRNARGGTTRSLTEGGAQERVLEQQYREDSGSLLARWPRTAAILEALANAYAGDAQREDLEAEGREDDWA